jgi:hypothetical protein
MGSALYMTLSVHALDRRAEGVPYQDNPWDGTPREIYYLE